MGWEVGGKIMKYGSNPWLGFEARCCRLLLLKPHQLQAARPQSRSLSCHSRARVFILPGCQIKNTIKLAAEQMRIFICILFPSF